MPYKGTTTNGIVISESASKKLTSGHLYKKRAEFDTENDVVSKSKFIAFAATKSNQLSKEQLDLIDDDGVVKVGSKVKPGQVPLPPLERTLPHAKGRCPCRAQEACVPALQGQVSRLG